MKVQVAFEYMLIVIIALVFMIPIWIYITTIKTETTSELSLTYAKNAVEKIASTADLIYSQGPPAKVQVSVFIPEGIEDYYIVNNTVNYMVLYSNSFTDVFATSRARLNGTLPTVAGNYWIEIKAVENENYDIFIQAI